MRCYDPLNRIGLVIDEWGTWWNVEDGTNPRFLYQQNTLRDAFVASLHFDIFHRHADRLVMTNIAQTVNVLQSVVLTHGNELIRTPTYHVLEMNKGHHDAASLAVHLFSADTRVTTDGGDLETLSMSASVKDVTALLSFTNMHADQDVELDVELRGRSVGDPQARILIADSLQAHNASGSTDEVSPRSFDGARLDKGRLTVQLPAHSFVTVALTVS
jgi:alpha-L-arabinofuranosidase